MLYSLARLLIAKPNPPFSVGGRLLRQGPCSYLTDAKSAVELSGPSEIFASAKSGDLVIVTARPTAPSAFSSRGTGPLSVERLQIVKPAEAEGVPPPRPHAARFVAFQNRIRRFFIERGLSEILSPTLVPCPGLEPSLEPFSLEVWHGRRRIPFFLPTSPEIHLKKALIDGYTDIFEIKTCFRGGEFSPHHEAEFQMLEWYRAYADLHWIESDLRDLLRVLLSEGWVSERENGLGEILKAVQIRVTDFATLFRDHLHFQLRPQTTAAELRELCKKLGVHTADDDHFNDLFHRLLVDRLEGEIANLGPAIVKRFPPSQAALATLDSDGWADRFEFYWHGLEIANAFNEVTDADEQVRRWSAEQAERERLGTRPLTQDARFVEALKRYGMPPTGGIALGLERLYMACSGVEDIRELKLYSASDLFLGR